MKMKKGLFSVVFLLAISSVMAAMSYSSASVTSDLDFSVVNSNQALLALEPNTDHYAASIDKATGKMDIQLDKGYRGNWGVQNGSDYKWDKLFTVKNNSENDISVKVYAKAKSNKGPHETMEAADAEAAFWKPGPQPQPTKYLTITNGKSSNEITFDLKKGTSQEINLQLLTDKTSLNTKDFDLIVEAVAK